MSENSEKTPNRGKHAGNESYGAADIKPIAHLYKTQVYQLADHLKVPEVIRMPPPTLAVR